ncbi:MAG: tail fiber protein [Candidatus Nanopelagicales bacterium]|nr:tail fiber protein [Candidatus Nanopelagicales bacterium]
MRSYLINGQFTLTQDPVASNEVATKQFVDNTFGYLDASDITGEGRLPGTMLPGISILANTDFVSTAGTGVLSLRTRVSAGTYTRLQVLTRGVVSTAGGLQLSDLTGLLPFSKYSADRPSDLDGYGITDAFSATDRVLTGPLSFTGVTFTNPAHLVTKGYVDSLVTAGGGGEVEGVETGDILAFASETTPAGHYRCNGGVLNSGTNAALFTAIGDLHAPHYPTEAGRPWLNQTLGNRLQTSPNLGTFASNGTLPVNLAGASAAVIKNRVYVFGGFTGAAFSSAIYSAPINSDGSFGSWSNVGTMPGSVSLYHSVVAAKGHVYIIGGMAGTTGDNKIYRAAVAADGTLGSFVETLTMHVGIQSGASFVHNDTLYVAGGGNTGGQSVTSVVYGAKISEDGSLGIWALRGTMPVGMTNMGVVVVQNRLHLIGGGDSMNANASATVLTATFGFDGSLDNWEFGPELVERRGFGTVFSTATHMYYIGGTNGSAYLNTVYNARILADGRTSTWAINGGIPVLSVMGAMVATSGKLHLMGGSPNGAATIVNTIYTATIYGGQNDYSEYVEDSRELYASGSGQPWRQQYVFNTDQTLPLGSWVSHGNLPATLSQSQVVVTKNRIFTLGGYVNGLFSANVYSAPIDSEGLIGAWASAGSIPLGVVASQAVACGGRIYVLGGAVNGGHSGAVHFAEINEDGTLGSWTTTTALATTLFHSQAVVTKNRIYLIGGYANGGRTSDVRTAAVNADGSLGAWEAAPNLPQTVYQAQAAIIDDTIYLFGGYVNNVATPTSYSAPIRSDGTIGNWSAGPALPASIAAGQAVVTRGRVYLIGGIVDGGPSTSVYSAVIQTNGSLSSWASGAALPFTVVDSQVAVTEGYVYSIGGAVNGSNSSVIYRTAFLGGQNDYSSYYVRDKAVSGTTIAGAGRPWEQQSDIYTGPSTGGWQMWSPYGESLPVSISAASVIVTKNRVYTLGGYVNGTPSSAIYGATINGVSEISTFTSQAVTLPYAAANTQSVFTKSRVYVIGGFNSTVGALNKVSTATINSDGTLGTFSEVATLPNTYVDFSAAVIGAKLYLFGGSVNDVTVATVVSYPIDSDGVVNFTTATAESPLAQPIRGGHLVVLSDRVHIVGGMNDAMDVVANTMNAPIDSGGNVGTWTLVPADENSYISSDVMYAGTIVLNNKVFLIGGKDAYGYPQSVIRSGEITSGNMLGTWTEEYYLNLELSDPMVFASNNNLYVVGGVDSLQEGQTQIYHAPIANGVTDLSPYYEGVSFGGGPSGVNFYLPNLETEERLGRYYYIKA